MKQINLYFLRNLKHGNMDQHCQAFMLLLDITKIIQLHNIANHSIKSVRIFSYVLYFVWNTYKFHNGIELSKLIQKSEIAWYKAWTNYKIFLEDNNIRNE